MFRYKIEWWNDFWDKTEYETGFIGASNFSKAAKALERNCTSPSGECDLISLELYEVDHINGAITDDELLETIEKEKTERE